MDSIHFISCSLSSTIWVLLLLINCLFLISDRGIMEPLVSPPFSWFPEALMPSVYTSSKCVGWHIRNIMLSRNIMCPFVSILTSFLPHFIHPLTTFHFTLLRFIHFSNLLFFLEWDGYKINIICKMKKVTFWIFFGVQTRSFK